MIVRDRQEYLAALQDADNADEMGITDVGRMEVFLSRLLKERLA